MAECRYCSNLTVGTQVLEGGGELDIITPLDFIACSDHIDEMTKRLHTPISQSFYDKPNPQQGFYEWNNRKVEK